MELRDWTGFTAGFLFGTIGLFVLALFALAVPFVEHVSSVLFAPGRLLAEQFVGSEGSTGAVVLLSLANGILYGLIGAAVQLLSRRAPTSSARKH